MISVTFNQSQTVLSNRLLEGSPVIPLPLAEASFQDSQISVTKLQNFIGCNQSSAEYKV